LIWPRYRIGTLMILVAVAGVLLGVIRAVGDAASMPYLLGLCCWPVLTLSATIRAFDHFQSRKLRDRGWPEGELPRPRLRFVLASSSAGVLVMLIYSLMMKIILYRFFMAGILSIEIAAVMAFLLMLGLLVAPKGPPPW